MAWSTDGEQTSITPPGGGAGTSFSYDGFARLRQVTLPDGRVGSYRYDALGRRTAVRLDGSLVRRYVYGGSLWPQARVDAAGSVLERYVYGSQAHAPDLIVRRDGQRIRLVTDSVGSVRVAVDADSGVVLERLDYDAYGRTTRDTNPGLQPFGFKGALADPVAQGAGLVWMGIRPYQPGTGRFLIADPIGLRAGWNRNDALGNDPINMIDPTGASFVTVAKAISGAAGAVATAAGAVSVACVAGLSPTVVGVGLCAPAAVVTGVAGAVAAGADVAAAVAGAPDPAALLLDGLGLVGGSLINLGKRIPGAVTGIIKGAGVIKDEFLNAWSSLLTLYDLLNPDEDESPAPPCRPTTPANPNLV